MNSEMPAAKIHTTADAMQDTSSSATGDVAGDNANGMVAEAKSKPGLTRAEKAKKAAIGLVILGLLVYVVVDYSRVEGALVAFQEWVQDNVAAGAAADTQTAFWPPASWNDATASVPFQETEVR